MNLKTFAIYALAVVVGVVVANTLVQPMVNKALGRA